MLNADTYTLVDLLCVSKPLYKQLKSRNNGDVCSFSVYKAVLRSKTQTSIAYFLGEVDFGRESIIEVTREKLIPLLYLNDYKILHKTAYNINTKLIEKLLNKKKL